MTPLAALRRGLEILDPTMRANGFAFSQVVSGRGSGGNYARGSYIKGDRRLELHYRFSLGLVTYHIGGDALRHEVFMRAILGADKRSRYPGFSDDAMAAFKDLRFDLETYAGDFLRGTGDLFRRCVRDARAARELSAFERSEQGWPNSIQEMP
jgi:hypothetical protein